MTNAKTNTFEKFDQLRAIFGTSGTMDPFKVIPQNRNERIVFKTAMETVGGVENSIADGEWDGDEVTFEELASMALADAFIGNERQVRFIGSDRARELCEIAAALFEA